MTAAFQENAFQDDAFQVEGAQYKLLLPHFINNAWLPAGTIVNEGIEIPYAWPPTAAVDPISSDAVAAFYAAGPTNAIYEDLNTWALGQVPLQSTTYWVRFGTNQFKLTGLGANLPPVSA